jgi:hypothetical protein
MLAYLRDRRSDVIETAIPVRGGKALRRYYVTP